MNYFKINILITCLIAFSSIYAQKEDEGNLGSEDIIVIKAYEARISDAKKINTYPSTKEVEIEKQKLNYKTPEKKIELEYPAHQVRPLAMPKIKYEKYLNSYVKLGFGVHIGDDRAYLSPLAEIVYNNNETKNLTYGAHYKHFSAWGGELSSQKFRNEDARVYAKYFLKKMEIGADLNFKQDVDFFFGHSSDTTLAKSIRQAGHNYGVNIFAKNASYVKDGIDYNQKIGFNYFADAHNINEWVINYEGIITKTFKNLHNLDIMSGIDISNYIPTNRDDEEREIFKLGAAYTFNDDNWKLKAGIDFAVGEVAEDKNFDFYPIIYTEKRLYKHMLIFYSSWSRVLKINTYRNMISENPYINLNPKVKNSRVEDRIVGFKGTHKKINYNARFTNKVITDMPLYLNDTSNTRRFNVVYEKVLKVYNINAEVGFSWTKNFKTQLTVDYRLYEPTFLEKAWHLPALNTNLSATYNLKNKFFIDFEFYALMGAWAKNKVGKAEIINGTADINLGINYKYSKNLFIFIKLNNLAHSKQTKFYNYNNYGFNGMLGAKFEF